MKKKTRALAQGVREALLTLPDSLLMQTFNEWFEGAEEQTSCPNWVDDIKFELGYRVQSDETEIIYTTIDAYCEAEPDGCSFSWLIPNREALRANLSLE